MTELTFLMELFLEDELPKPIKKKIVERIREVEKTFEERDVPRNAAIRPVYSPAPQGEEFANQAPSMQRIMQQNPELIPKPPVPVTPAAAQALAARQALLMSAGMEKPEPGRNSKRKM